MKLTIWFLLIFITANANKTSFQTDLGVKETPLAYTALRDNDEQSLAFCSFKRTGSTLTYSILTELTKRPCLWSIQKSRWERTVSLNRALCDLDLDLQPIYGTHFISDLVEVKNCRLICTYRDYKALIHRMVTTESLNKQQLNAKIGEYIEFLKFYDNFPYEKTLVCFEELMENPRQVIYDLGGFVGALEEVMEELCSNFSEFNQKVLASYDHFPGGRSKSDKVVNSRNKSESEVARITAILKKSYPYIFSKYLKE